MQRRIPDSKAIPTRTGYLPQIGRQPAWKLARRGFRRTLKSPRRPGRQAADADPVDGCPLTTDAFNQLLRQADKRDCDFAVRIFTRMHDKGVPLDLQTYNLLLDVFADTDLDLLLQVYEGLRETVAGEYADFTVEQHTFLILFRACERFAAYGRAFQFFHDMKAEFGVQPDVSLYNALLGFCAAVRDQRTASDLFEEMKEKGMRPNIHTYNTLMNVFSDAPFEVIQQMFDDISLRGLEPNLRSYNTIIRACQRCGQFDRAFWYFDELKVKGLRPCVVTYTTLLEMCAERVEEIRAAATPTEAKQCAAKVAEMAATAMELFVELQEDGATPTLLTYNTLMMALGRAADPRVFEVFDAVLEHQRAATAALAAPEAAAALRAAAEEDERTKTAESQLKKRVTLAEYLTAGERAAAEEPTTADGAAAQPAAGEVLQPDRPMYTTLIMACEAMRQPQKAWEFFQQMKAVGIKPDKATYIHMLDVCVLQADGQPALGVQKARELLAEAKARQIPTDADLSNCLLKVLAQAQDETILAAFAEMQAQGMRPNQATYNMLLVACQKRGDVQLATKLYNDMLAEDSVCRPDAGTFAILMELCGAARETAWARALLRDMRRCGLPVAAAAYNRCIAALVQADDPQAATDLLAEMRRDGPEPNLETYRTLLIYYHGKLGIGGPGTAVAEGEAIVQLFEELKESHIALDLHVYNVVLGYCAHVRDKRLALKFFEELKMRGLAADVDTYNALMAVFAESGDPLIHKVLEEMAESAIPPNPQTYSVLIKHKKGLECLRHAAEQGRLLPQLPGN
eukprot:EG_transcript_2480